MVRACCVPGCTSGKKDPSHRFPRNARRLQWFKQLNMETVEGPEEQKLRVCHKHFRDSGYSCSRKMRVLVSDAVASANVTLNEGNVTDTIYQTSQNVETAKTVRNNEEEDLILELNEPNEQQRAEEIVTRSTVKNYCCSMKK